MLLEGLNNEMLYEDMIPVLAKRRWRKDRGQTCEPPALSATPQSDIIKIREWRETSTEAVADPCLTEKWARQTVGSRWNED